MKIRYRLYKSLVADNDHTRAYWLAAHDLGDPTLEKELRDLERRREHHGGLFGHLIDERNAWYDLMINLAKKRLSKTDFDRFHSCF